MFISLFRKVPHSTTQYVHYGVLTCVSSQVLPMGPYELLQGGSYVNVCM